MASAPSLRRRAGADSVARVRVDPARIDDVGAGTRRARRRRRATTTTVRGETLGDLEAALDRVLGTQARWRPRDSQATTTTFGAQRTWVDRNGARKLYSRHLTLGHGVDAQRCAQIYYDVTSDGRIELAWIGEHRPTVSEEP